MDLAHGDYGAIVSMVPMNPMMLMLPKVLMMPNMTKIYMVSMVPVVLEALMVHMVPDVYCVCRVYDG